MPVMAEHISSAELTAIRKRLRLTQEEMAEAVGVNRGTYKNWEYGQNIPERYILAIRRVAARGSNDVGPPSIPASELMIPIPYIGLVNASTPANWDSPSDTDTMEFVPLEMGDARGRHAARVESDCMYPMLHPDDLVVFQEHNVPRINKVVLFRTHDGKVTIKQLKHNGTDYVLHALNPKIEDQIAHGSVVGYLVGKVRWIGRRKITDYDPDGLTPEFF